MRRFYGGTLGLRESFSHEGRMCGFHTGGAMLVLETAAKSSRGVIIGFSCTGLEALVSRLRAQGVPITTPPEDGHWGERMAVVEDPEGNRISFEEPIPRGKTTSHRHPHRSRT